MEERTLFAVPKHRRRDLEDDEYKDWITQQPCCICHCRGEYHDDGTWRVTPSHMRTKGAQHGHYFNLLPMCWVHHRSFEESSAHERESWEWLATRLTREYFNRTDPTRYREVYERWHVARVKRGGSGRWRQKQAVLAPPSP